jgi:hypothetical protein
VWSPPEEIPGAFPPLISATAAYWLSAYVFLIYASVCSKIASGDLYICVFRSRPLGMALEERLRTLEEGKRWCGTARGGGHAT